MFNENAVRILEERYLLKNEEGNVIETPTQMLRRVANFVAEPEGKSSKLYAQKFYEIMDNEYFLPNSPTLMNAGTPNPQMSACFVLDLQDSMSGIFTTLHDAALIHKTGGGTGFPFSNIRSANSAVKSTGGVASGPISFAKVYNVGTETVKQGGKRRGANMGTFRVDHPDIIDFIKVKSNPELLVNFNLSIALTDAFMSAVEVDGVYSLIDPHTKQVCDVLSARYVLDLIAQMAWENGEPGVIFIDVMNKFNPTPLLGVYMATNPCGEQPLLSGESCVLGSINVAKFLTEDNDINWDKLREVVHLAVRFLDNVISQNTFVLDYIKEATLKTRKIGLGIMGLADLLVAKGIAYDSYAGRGMASIVMRFINDEAHAKSRSLGRFKGSFPAKESSIYNKLEHMRNATVTTIAPTGTISMLADTSPGMEPLFGLAYTKIVMDDVKLKYINKYLEKALKDEGIYSDELIEKIIKKGTLQDIDEIPDRIKDVFKCSHDISVKDQILMQAALQKHVDNAISKTLNFTNDTTVDDVKEAIILAYDTGCKGVTVYRDGSRDSQVITKGDEVKTTVDTTLNSLSPRQRTETTYGFTKKVPTGCGNLYVTVNLDDKGICEVFTHTGKGGGCHSQSESTARLVTLALRSNISYDNIVLQLKGIRCPAAIRNPKSKCLSCPDAIATVLLESHNVFNDTINPTLLSKSISVDIDHSEHSDVEQEVEQVIEQDEQKGNKCPQCGEPLAHYEGCIMCRCGFSKCN